MTNLPADNVLLFGASGNVGFAIAQELRRRNFNATAVVRSDARAERLSKIGCATKIVDVLERRSIRHITSGYSVVVSALGKSVSLNDKSNPSFQQVDFEANSDILQDALKTGCRKFVYVSALHCERYMHLEYCRVHQAFSDTLIASGVDYSIIKPAAIFSAFVDLIDLARKGKLVGLGKGNKRTNPIFEGDLARICVDSISLSNAVIEAGGKFVYSRKQLIEIIHQTINPSQRLVTIPTWIIKAMLPILKVADKNTFDKLAFFLEVMAHDTIGPQVGELSFEDYVRHHRDVIIHQK